MAARGPTFRSNLIAFVAMTAIVVAAATGLLVLLDPRTQAWWGGRFAEVGAVVRELFSTILRR